MSCFTIDCRCVIAGTDIPVRDARCILSDNCGKEICRVCNIFGVCCFCVPCGCYIIRCACTPAFAFPDLRERVVCVNCRYPEAALTFHCPEAPPLSVRV